jgi:hypothetical protein
VLRGADFQDLDEALVDVSNDELGRFPLSQLTAMITLPGVGQLAPSRINGRPHTSPRAS